VREKLRYNIHSEHRKRLRMRYIREGLDNFEEHEILEMLLHYPIGYMDTNELGHRLINKFGKFSSVMDASKEEMIEVDGIGEYSATFLQLVGDLCEQYLIMSEEDDTVFKTIREAAIYCIERCGHIKGVCYSVVLFDVAGKVIGFEELPNCTWTDTDSITKALGKYVFGYNANSFILIRTSDDGNITPTDMEMLACTTIYNFFKLFNRMMIEYFIISENKYMPVYKYCRDYVIKEVKAISENRFGINEKDYEI